ncbi:MAG: HesA/MoeB/ThiF family protein [Endomicrobium sp.]|jgi:adenylyltransferase/sulfurtransferase|nr:HesA/MoeB/ThiF family protein [Endomicrobium sp.]
MQILTNNFKERYKRQLIIKSVGKKGQQKLFNAKVLVCGAGGLGGTVLTYLTAAGVGKIGICDFDIVEQSNLNRQILYDYSDIKKQKVYIAKKKLKKFNPDVKIKIYTEKLTENNVSHIFKNYDMVIDALDNFEGRYIINAAAYKTSTPLVSGAVCEFEGILTVIIPKENTTCFQCIYPIKPSQKFISKTFGIIGATAGIMGSMQALESIKFILGLRCISNKILIFNSIKNTYRIRDILKKKYCPICK